MEKGGNGDGVSPPADAEDADPQVTAITRRLDRTGDTLGAIGELEQLLIERTGQIPVVPPELLAAHGARIAHAPQKPPADPDAIDWSLPSRLALDPAPGFSPWVDPDAIAAAFDAQAATEFTDVSTKVFAVFSAERSSAPHEAGPVRSEPGGAEAPPVPLPQPGISTVPVPQPQSPVDELDELDGIDDLVGAAPPVSISGPAAPAADGAAVLQSKPKRRFWPFGRR